MGRKLKFKLGSFYRKDDRTGFPQRAGRTKKEWQGLIVDRRVWEPRQPQDFVKGVKDIQTVPDARPLPPNVFKGPIYVALSADAAVGATVLVVQAIEGFSDGDPIGVMTDVGQYFDTTVDGTPSGNNIPIADPLALPAASGNLVVNTAHNPTIYPGGYIPPVNQ